MSKYRTASRLNVSALLGVCALAGLGVAGCEGDTEDSNAPRAQIDCNETDGSVDGGADGGVVDGGSDGGPIVGIDSGLDEPVITAVTANGTGCAPGTWTSELSADGTEAVVNFSAFELEVAPGLAVSVKDCSLGLQVRAKEGRSYQIQRVALDGVNHLDQGVSTRIETTRYFQGDPTTSDVWQVELRGKSDEELSLESPEGSQLWSPCGVQRDINVRIGGRMLNSSSPQANGLVTLDKAHVFKLVSRACE